MRNEYRRYFLKFAAISAAMRAMPILGQTGFPNGPVRMIVGTTAGGGMDAIVRPMGILMEKSLSVPVVVENKPGGQFTISVNSLTGAPANGQTVLALFSSYAAVQATEKLFNLETQVNPVAKVATSPVVLMVRSDSRFKTLQEMVQYARANPGKLNYATLGPGSLEHLWMEMIEQALGIRGTAIPYRGGIDMMNALLAGDIDVTIEAGYFAKAFATKARSLVVLGAQRWEEFSDVPTLSEVSGTKIQPMEYWIGYAVRAGTPPDVIARLSKEFDQITRNPEIVAKLAATGFYPSFASASEFQRLIRSELTWMQNAAKPSGPK